MNCGVALVTLPFIKEKVLNLSSTDSEIHRRFGLEWQREVVR